MKSGGAPVLVLCLASCSQVFGLDGPSRMHPIDAAGDVDSDEPDAQLAPSLLSIIQSANAASGLLVALDAGDLAAYDGTDATWHNTVPGSVVSFHRGGSAAPEQTDPAFHGTAGARTANEYFAFDGDDFFVETVAG